MANGLTPTSTRIIRAVKAELARRDKSGVNLTEALELSSNAIYERLRYEKPFNTDEIERIANYLGITVADLLRSAQLDRETAPAQPAIEIAQAAEVAA
jgi:DNA-binding Xre family transcriptional regulator